MDLAGGDHDQSLPEHGRRRKVLYFRWLKRRRVDCEAASDDKNIECDETGQRVRDAVAKLSPRDRELIVLHYLEELSIPEISKIIGAGDKVIHVRCTVPANA